MPSLKEVQTKITAVKKTRQITKAMNMVATSRLRGAQTRMEGFRPYADKFKEVLSSVAEKAGEEVNPLLVSHDDVKKIHVVLCTSDRGLCGGFNVNLIEHVQKTIDGKSDKNVDFLFTNFGRRGRDWCKRSNLPIADEHIGVVGNAIPFNIASTAGRKLVDGYLNGSYDEVYIVYAQFISMGKQIPVINKILPIPLVEAAEEEIEPDENTSYLAEHICEPSHDDLLEDLLPRNIFVQLYSALLETSTSEHAARMMAMDNATKACDDMVDSLTLTYNKARQTAITAELMDIVGGAEALSG
jgi:F-type H+-transporting ATPase subunit gamma